MKISRKEDPCTKRELRVVWLNPNRVNRQKQVDIKIEYDDDDDEAVNQ